mgnify:CR=1 FL=1
MNHSAETLYQALLDKDPRFEGIFYTAVKTTGIFCRPTCTARKPKFENVEFFERSKDALAAGYRPCKICKPLQLNGTPLAIESLIQRIQQQPDVRIKDPDLRDMNINPVSVRRWFMEHHGMTFHAYQRMLRLNSAFQRIQHGEPVTRSAMETGFDSLSGFQDAFKAIFGFSPKHSRTQSLIYFTRLHTVLGTMVACATEQGICLLEFSDRKGLENELLRTAQRKNATIIQSHHPHFDVLTLQLNEYFAGERTTFDVPIELIGTPFQIQVWQELRNIKYGQTRSYAQQAQSLARPEAIRAVANANGCNQIAIIVPCHRVIGSDGKLVGYAGGLVRKKWLLDLEQSKM